MEYQTAAEFTMGSNFDWINDGILVEDCQTPRQIEAFVREYVKGYIIATNSTKASNTTVYKMWRSGGEFEALCNHVAQYVEAQ